MSIAIVRIPVLLDFIVGPAHSGEEHEKNKRPPQQTLSLNRKNKTNNKKRFYIEKLLVRLRI